MKWRLDMAYTQRIDRGSTCLQSSIPPVGRQNGAGGVEMGGLGFALHPVFLVSYPNEI